MKRKGRGKKKKEERKRKMKEKRKRERKRSKLVRKHLKFAGVPLSKFLKINRYLKPEVRDFPRGEGDLL